MSIRNKAPRVLIEKAWRVGPHGSVTWHHLLRCGHIEISKRSHNLYGGMNYMGCTKCGADGQANDAEALYNKARTQVAWRLGLPLDAVEVTMEESRPVFAKVWLDGLDLRA